MKADVTFLIGRSGTGKSRGVFEKIRALFHVGRRPVLIVPEQFTFETEKLLSEFMGGGLLGIRVLSFTTLSRKVLQSAGRTQPFLSPQGRRMVIRKLARQRRQELRVFANIADRGGFAGECDSFFSLCKRFEMTPQQLMEAAERLGDGNRLADKLHDFALLFADMESYLAGRYLDGEDAFREMIARLPGSDIAGEPVFIDGFDLLTNQLYSVMGVLMDTAESLTVTIRMDPDETARDADVFRPERRAYEKLRVMAQERGCRIREKILPDPAAPGGGIRAASPAMLHLEKELFVPVPRPYCGEDCGVTLFSASNPAAEISALTAAVQAAAKSGIRYRDMTVVAADMGGYAAAIRRAFHAEGIPVFTDAKHPVRGHPAAELCLSAMRLVCGGFARSDYLRLIKNGLAGVSPEDCEILENYLLRYGITGRRLMEPFVRGEVPEAAERARLTLEKPLAALQAGMAEQSASDKTRALFAFLQELQTAEQLDALADRLFDAGRFEEAEETAQIWNILMELMDQLHVILGDLNVSRAEYTAMFSEGLDAYEIGVIPTTADQVLLGGVSRTRSRSVRALFVIGAAEGRFPVQHMDDAVVDDAELRRLSDMGLAPWGNTLIRTENDRLDIYNAFSRVSERLFVSWPMNVDGAAKEPSSVFEQLQKIFPGAERLSDVGGNTVPPVSRGLAREPLIRGLRAYVDTGAEEQAPGALYASFAEEEPAFPARIADALFYRASPEKLPQDMARTLYGVRLCTSATRLETFNGCPFRHFARYGLGAEERQEYEERPIDEGSFCHEALDAFVKTVKERGLDWQTMDETACHTLLAELLPPIIAQHNGGMLTDGPRMLFRLAELIRTVETSAAAMARQIAAGSFRPEGTEISFGPGETLPPLSFSGPNGEEMLLCGKIDRVDSTGGDLPLYQVVDYKRGGKKFDYSLLYSGVLLQLPLYLAAVKAARPKGTAAGMYYFPILDPAVDEQKEDAEQEAFREFRLSGLTLADTLEYADHTSDADKSAVLPSARSGGRLLKNEMEFVLEFARGRAGKTLAQIYAGGAELAPYKRGQYMPCRYCEYKGACGFDEKFADCRKRALSSMDKNAFFDRSAEKGDDDGGTVDE